MKRERERDRERERQEGGYQGVCKKQAHTWDYFKECYISDIWYINMLRK